MNFCNNCRFITNNKRCIYGEFYNNNNGIIDVIILGEAPGREEEKQSRVFVGKSGQLLKMMLRDHLNHNISCFITNCLECRPVNNNTPSSIDLLNCKQKLWSKIKAFQPKIILTLGKTAFINILNLKQCLNFSKIVFSNEFPIIDTKDYKIIVIPNFHPAYLLYNNHHINKQIFINKIKIINTILLQF